MKQLNDVQQFIAGLAPTCYEEDYNCIICLQLRVRLGEITKPLSLGFQTKMSEGQLNP